GSSFRLFLGAFGSLMNASRSWPVPSITATFLPVRLLAIIIMGKAITPVISSGKKSVMKMNIFFRTAWKYSRFRTAKSFRIAAKGIICSLPVTPLHERRRGSGIDRLIALRHRFRRRVQREHAVDDRRGGGSVSCVGERRADAGASGFPGVLSEVQRHPEPARLVPGRHLQCEPALSADAGARRRAIARDHREAGPEIREDHGLVARQDRGAGRVPPSDGAMPARPAAAVPRRPQHS